MPMLRTLILYGCAKLTEEVWSRVCVWVCMDICAYVYVFSHLLTRTHMYLPRRLTSFTDGVTAEEGKTDTSRARTRLLTHTQHTYTYTNTYTDTYTYTYIHTLTTPKSQPLSRAHCKNMQMTALRMYTLQGQPFAHSRWNTNKHQILHTHAGTLSLVCMCLCVLFVWTLTFTFCCI